MNNCLCSHCANCGEVKYDGFLCDETGYLENKSVSEGCQFFKEENFTYHPGEIKPEFCRIRSVFKSLYHDLLPDMDITLQCSILPENDMVTVCQRVKNAAYREYQRIMQEEMEKEHGFSVTGTWDTVPEEE